jgi:hypothetical protein
MRECRDLSCSTGQKVLTSIPIFDVIPALKTKRKTKSLNLSNSRWLAYAAAGAASTLGGAHSAEAEIHYSGVINDPAGNGRGDVNITIPLGHNARLRFDEYTYNLDFAIDGAAVSNDFCAYKGRYGTYYVSRLHQGAVISNCQFLSPRQGFGVLLFLSPFSGGPFFEGNRLHRLPLQ